MVLPEDEIREKAGRRKGAAGAVPYLSLTEYPGGREAGAPVWLAGNMPKRPGCDHRALRVALFDAPPAAWKSASVVLSKRWRAKTRAALGADSVLETLAPAAGLESAKGLEDLLKILKDE
jgi:hypothetical protein